MMYWILVTCVGSTNALSIIKALRIQDEFEVRILGVDCAQGRWTAGAEFCDDFVTVPSFDEGERYVEALAALVKKRSIDLLLPILDREVALLGRHRDAFPSRVVQFSPQETLELGLDKLAANDFLLEHGFDTPRTIDASDASRVRKDIARLGLAFPLIAKPRRGCSSNSVFELSSPDELCLLGRIEEPILQERAPGQEYTVDVFRDGHRVIACVPRARLASKAGQVYKARIETEPFVVAETGRLAEALRLLGPANVQGFRDADTFKVTDFNPRTSGGLPLTTAAGVNIPLLCLHLALGRPLDPIQDIASLTMCRYWEEVLRKHDDLDA